MPLSSKTKRFQLREHDRVLELIPGPKPYLWIGDAISNEHLADFGPAGLRELRDALTVALKRAKDES